MLRCKKIQILILLFCCIPGGYRVLAQDAATTAFYYRAVSANPALTGSEGDGKIKLMYRDYYPGRNLNLHSVYFSYDTFAEQVHGGLGLYLSDDMLGGILNELRAGGTYSYHLRAGKDLFINAGFMASVIHRGIKTGNIILPDQIDPLMGAVLPPGEVINPASRTVFDAGLGFLFTYRDYHTGISVNHIFRPDINGSGQERSRLHRLFSVHGAALLKPGAKDISLNPAFIISMGGNIITAAIGTSVSYKNISMNLLPYFSPAYGLSFVQSGVHVNTGRVELGYNYNFNPLPDNSLQPFTLSNQVFISVVLNNIKKRDVVKAIIYPKL